ncbi:MAG: hypothetical protein QM778_18960 [Myxococcales bacterium]
MEFGRVVLKTMGWVRVDDVLIQCAGLHDTDDAELTEWLVRLGTFDYQALLISVRGGGGLTSKQRGRIGDFWKKAGRKPPPTALLTDSVVARHIGTAITWLIGSPLKGFEPGDVAAATAYLNCKAGAVEIGHTLDSVHTALAMKGKRSA